MTLCDAGPLFALIDRRDAAHSKCVEIFRTLEKPLLTTWACFTEAMYLLGRDSGWKPQSELWIYRTSGMLHFQEFTLEDEEQMASLMERYRDVPMDLADASRVTTAETTGLRRIFTLDRDFLIYRTGNGDAFEVVP